MVPRWECFRSVGSALRELKAIWERYLLLKKSHSLFVSNSSIISQGRVDGYYEQFARISLCSICQENKYDYCIQGGI